MNERSPNALNSTGLSSRYDRLGAVKVSGSSDGYNWVATRQSRSAGGMNRTVAGRASIPTPQSNEAGMFRCAWVSSMAR